MLVDSHAHSFLENVSTNWNWKLDTIFTAGGNIELGLLALTVAQPELSNLSKKTIGICKTNDEGRITDLIEDHITERAGYQLEIR